MARWFRAAVVLLVAATTLLAARSPSYAASDQGTQELITELAGAVSWGDENGCVQNVATNDFGSLTPSLGASTRGAFDAFPHADASVDGEGQHVWVGCVTANGPLGVSVQGAHDLRDGAGHVLPMAQIAIGVTNRPGGRTPDGCGVVAGQAAAGGCTLPADGTTDRILVDDLPAGTTELHWQYQLDLPGDQPAGDYQGGDVVFTATAADTVAMPPALAPPAAVAAPVVSGAATRGQALTATQGTFTGTVDSYNYRWRRCDGTGGDCADIAGATSSSYTLVTADVDHTLRVVVTATNADGSASATSTATATVGSAYTAAILADHAVGFWRMSEGPGATTAADTISGGQPLTLSGAGGALGALGVLGGAATFPGDTTAVLGGALAPTADGSVSAEAWIKTTDASSGLHPVVVFAGTGFGIYVSNGRLAAYNPATGVVSAYPLKSVADGQWHQVGMTLGASILHMYRDGVHLANYAFGAIPVTGNTVVVGNGDVADNGQRFNGSIDEVSVYDALLGAPQMANHYARGLSG